MKFSKKVLAVFLALALCIGVGVMSVAVNAAEDDVVLNGDEAGLSSMIGDYSKYTNVTGYYYLGFATLNEADIATHKYLQMTYTGDITYLRLEFEKVGQIPAVKSAATWFTDEKDENNEFVQPAHFVTADNTSIPLIVNEPTTVVLDLAASGIDLTTGYDGLHMHYGDPDEVSNGFTITDARLMTTADVVVPTTADPDASTTEPATAAPTEAPTEATTQAPGEIVLLDGDEEGLSSMINDYSSITGTGYQYLGFVTLKDTDLSTYKYLQMTYTGDIYTLRMEFENIEAGDKSAATWFNGEKDENDEFMQPVHFISTEPAAIPLYAAEPTTIVIDLEASGIDLTAGFNGIHMHYLDAEIESAGFVITEAALTKSPEILDLSQQTTVEPTAGEDESTTAAVDSTAADESGSNPKTGVASVLPIAIALAASAGVIVFTAKKRK